MDMGRFLDTDIDWVSIFAFDTPALEIIARGTVMYLMLFLLLRAILKRQAGTVGMTDLLVIVLIADAAQNAMAADYRTIPDGLLLVTTLIFWNVVLEWLGYHFPIIQYWIHPPPLLLVKDGKIIYRNMRREFITEEELMSQVREQGTDRIESVKAAYMEGNGHISVICEGDKKPGRKKSLT